MVTKLARLKAAWEQGDPIEALRIAAKFPRLGPDAATITRAWAAHVHPGFYRQIGQHPETLVTAGLEALRGKYKL